MNIPLLLGLLLLTSQVLPVLERLNPSHRPAPLGLLGLTSAVSAGLLVLCMGPLTVWLSRSGVAELALLVRTLLALAAWPLLLAALMRLPAGQSADMAPYGPLITVNAWSLSLAPLPVAALLGFALLLPLYGALVERLRFAEVPLAWRGLPLQCVTLALLGLALCGLEGLWPWN